MKKTKRNIYRACFLFVVALTLFLPFTGGGAFAEGELVSAPMNPEFLSYMEALQKERVMAPEVSYEGYGLGLVPSPLSLDHLAGVNIFGVPQIQELAEPPLRLGLPVSYDLRTQGKLTPVKDQNPGNTCWTFATYGSMESNLLPGETNDFSENHMKNTHGFDWGYNDGGNGDMATAYLARWSGPVNEADDPYNAGSGVSPSGLSPRKHVQGVIYIPKRTSSPDNDNLKNAVMSAGAVYVTMYWEPSYYNSDTRAYYYNGTSGSNHAVAIVGWDDNYDKANFPSVPSGNGAFIVRNSWGSGFGDGGYFYISYYDTKLAYTTNYLFYNTEPTTNYSRIYQYDPLGWTSQIGYSSETGWFANIFTAQASESLVAVSFHNTSANSPYEIYIYTGVTAGVPRSGTLAATETGTIQYPGYTTIDLSSPVYLASGGRFSIVVKLTAPGVGTPIPLENRQEGYSSSATASAGQSFISSNGSTWSDLTTETGHANDNVCLKGFTTSSPLYATWTGDGLYKWNGTTWTRIASVPTSMIASGSNLYATWTGQGLYSWNGSTWTRISSVPASMVASGSNLYATWTGDGLYKWNGTTWTRIASVPASMIASGSSLYATWTGQGLYSWNGSAWTRIASVPASVVASGSSLYATWTGQGLYSWNGSAWTRIASVPASVVASGSNLYATWTGQGLYSWNGTTWTRISSVPTNVVASGSNLYASWTGQGLYSWNGSAWTRISSVPASMVASGSSLYATWTGQGLYSWNGSTWTRVASVPTSMVASGSSLYATWTGQGLYSWNGSAWTRISSVPTNMVASGSSLYATWTGDGLYSWNGTTWTRIASVPASMVLGD